MRRGGSAYLCFFLVCGNIASVVLSSIVFWSFLHGDSSLIGRFLAAAGYAPINGPTYLVCWAFALVYGGMFAVERCAALDNGRLAGMLIYASVATMVSGLAAPVAMAIVAGKLCIIAEAFWLVVLFLCCLVSLYPACIHNILQLEQIAMSPCSGKGQG